MSAGEVHESRELTFSAPRVSRVLRGLRDAFISPALLFSAEIRDHSQC